jgi:hypothetical protein
MADLAKLRSLSSLITEAGNAKGWPDSVERAHALVKKMLKDEEAKPDPHSLRGAYIRILLVGWCAGVGSGICLVLLLTGRLLS